MNDKRHNYEYEVDTASETAPAYVIKMVGQGRRVLEIGCGPGSITKILAQLNNCKVTGFEIDPDAIEKVLPYCESVMQVDLNARDWPTLLDNVDRFDVVVAADVLEHLYDPWSVLRQMVSLIRTDGYLVISLPHVGHAAVMSCLMNGDFDYRDWGLLDRTHIRFFGLRNIETLFAQAGLKIIEARYVVKPPEETEFAEGWSRLTDQVKEALQSSPHSDVYQVVVKAVPIDRAGDSVSLQAQKAPKSAIMAAATWKTRLGRHLSPQFKHMVRRSFGLLGIRL